MLRTIVPIFALSLACLPFAQARAATASATIGVSATVVASCTVGGTAVAFGAVQPGAAAQQQAALTVQCSTGTAYQVALNGGSSGGASRAMAGPDGSLLAYELYRDTARSQPWRDGADGSSGIGTGAAQTLPVYAAVMGGGGTITGNYSDTVTATLTY